MTAYVCVCVVNFELLYMCVYIQVYVYLHVCHPGHLGTGTCVCQTLP